MAIPVLGIVISSICIGALTLLFRHETNRGARFFPRLRETFDTTTTRAEDFFSKLSRYIGRDMLRQTIHYIFHSVLTVVLLLLERFETHVLTALRRNKSLAHRVGNLKRTRNKLDEVAEHKLEVALSESEKKKHKKEMLEG